MGVKVVRIMSFATDHVSAPNYADGETQKNISVSDGITSHISIICDGIPFSRVL